MAKTHYDTLEVAINASQADIKQSYRRLAKVFHPDSHHSQSSHERIATLNAAYEILGDPRKRQYYDAQINVQPSSSPRTQPPWYPKQAPPQPEPRKRTPPKGCNIDEQIHAWMKQVYTPINRVLGDIIEQLGGELRDLSADPFDDRLLEAFQLYLDDCHEALEQSQQRFRSLPNPSTMAGVASNLYHCLNQVSDGVDELERFISCYDEHYLHTGQELFRIAHGLKYDAQIAIHHLF